MYLTNTELQLCANKRTYARKIFAFTVNFFLQFNCKASSFKTVETLEHNAFAIHILIHLHNKKFWLRSNLLSLSAQSTPQCSSDIISAKNIGTRMYKNSGNLH